MSEAKKLEWTTGSDGQRVYTNIEEGQLILSRTIFGTWMLDGFAIHDDRLRLEATRWLAGIIWSSIEEAKNRVTDWYESQGKG